MRLRERKRRDRQAMEDARMDAALIRTGAATIDEVLRRNGGPRETYSEAVRKMLDSPRAKIPNTNEWRIAEKHRAKAQRIRERLRRPKTPLQILSTFLYHIAPYSDPRATLSWEDQQRHGIPHRLCVPQYARAYTALPGAPQDQIEAAWRHIEARIQRITGNGSRARAVSTWLGRWSIAIENEIARRLRGTPFPTPDHLVEIEKRERERWAEEHKLMHTVMSTGWERRPPMQFQTAAAVGQLAEVEIDMRIDSSFTIVLGGPPIDTNV